MNLIVQSTDRRTDQYFTNLSGLRQFCVMSSSICCTTFVMRSACGSLCLLTQAAEDLGHIINVPQDPVNLQNTLYGLSRQPPDRTKPSGHCLWNFKDQALCKGNIHVAMYRWLYLLRRTVVLFFWEVKWTSQILAEREREAKHSSSAHHQKRAASWPYTHTQMLEDRQQVRFTRSIVCLNSYQMTLTRLWSSTRMRAL